MDFIQLQQLQQQAQEGNAHSAFYLGYLYETGARSDVTKDVDQAIHSSVYKVETPAFRRVAFS